MDYKVFIKYKQDNGDELKLLGVLNDCDVKIGRQVEPGNLLIKSTSVSREHGIFKRVNGRWYYSDLGSSNGTYAESRRLVEGEYFEIYEELELTLSDSIVVIKEITHKEASDIDRIKDEIKVSPSSHVADKKTYVFTPDMLDSLRKSTGVNTSKANINRHEYRGRRITDSPRSGILNDSGSLIIIIMGFMVLFIFFFILLFLFL